MRAGLRSSPRTMAVALALTASIALLAAQVLPSHAAAAAPDFKASFSEVVTAYYSAAGGPYGAPAAKVGPPRFAEAYRKLEPLMAAGDALSDPAERYQFYRHAALVTCMAGFPAAAKPLAAVASRQYTNASSAIVAALGQGSYLGIDHMWDIMRGDDLYLYRGNGSSGFGWSTLRRDCSLGVRLLASSNYAASSKRGPLIRLQCMWARSCSGALRITARPPEGGVGTTLGTARYSIKADSTRSLRLKNTLAGRSTFRRPATRKLQLVVAPDPVAGIDPRDGLGPSSRGQVIRVRVR